MAKRKSRPQTGSVPAAKAVVGMNAWAGGSNPSCGTEPDSRSIDRAAGMMRHTGALARSDVARASPASWFVQRGIFPGRTLPPIAPKRPVLSRTFAAFGFGSRVRPMLPQSEPTSEDRDRHGLHDRRPQLRKAPATPERLPQACRRPRVQAVQERPAGATRVRARCAGRLMQSYPTIDISLHDWRRHIGAHVRASQSAGEIGYRLMVQFAGQIRNAG